ncbi:hypothetical protein ACFV3R_25495 [Streptomyces sp. NPDC059740]|uniref:hypothetical protein n=1 Tax=Streptomyces sp. NPDC059740 TaxID=3346926 RepID=UPI0036463850
MSEQRSRGVVRLERLVERVAPRDPAAWEQRPPLRRGRQVSSSRARQLRATVAQLALAVEREEMPERSGRSVQALLAPKAIDVVFELAEQGLLRSASKPKALGKPLSWSALGTLRDCLVILGEEAGVEVVVPRVYRERQALKPVPAPEQTAEAYRRLADWAAGRPEDARSARTLAMVAVILDTGMQSGGMLSRRVEHLDLEEGSIVASYWPQNAAFEEPVVARVGLRPGTLAAVRSWLRFRRQYVERLEGSDHGALWVTVHPVMSAGWAAGMPLRRDGFRGGFRGGVERLNAVLARQWDASVRGPWVPLPTRSEQLRRSVDVDALVPELAEARARAREARYGAG